MASQPSPQPDLPGALAGPLTALGPAFSAAFGPRLHSLVVYGSVACGSYRPGRSDINLLILLDTVDLEALETVARLLRRARRLTWTPVVMTPTELVAAATTTPSTLWEIRDRHVRLAGGELPALPLDPDRLHDQLQRELRDKLQRLRADYLAARHPRELAGPLRAACPSLFHLLAALLRLRDVEPGYQPVQRLGQLARTLGLDLSGLQRLHGLIFGDDRPRPDRLPGLCADCLRLLEAALHQLDYLPQSRPAPPTEEPPAPATEAPAEPEEAAPAEPPAEPAAEADTAPAEIEPPAEPVAEADTAPAEIEPPAEPVAEADTAPAEIEPPAEAGP